MSQFLSPSQNTPQTESALEAALACLEAGQFTAAYVGLTPWTDSPRPDALFALGICTFQANVWERAVAYFEGALTAIKALRTTLPPRTDTYRALRTLEIARGVYLRPMREDFIHAHPQLAKENAVMALAVALVKLGQRNRAVQVAQALNGDEFSVIKAQIEQGQAPQ